MNISLMSRFRQVPMPLKKGKTIIDAQAKDKYFVIDNATGYTPQGTQVARLGQDLVIKIDSEQIELVIKDFWANCNAQTPCQLELDVPSTLNNSMGQVVLTQSDMALPQLIAGKTGALAEGQVFAVPSTNALLTPLETGLSSTYKWGLGIAGALGVAGVVAGSNKSNNTQQAVAPSVSVQQFVETNAGLSLTGQASPNATVAVMLDDKTIATTQADAQGKYTFNALDANTLLDKSNVRVAQLSTEGGVVATTALNVMSPTLKLSNVSNTGLIEPTGSIQVTSKTTPVIEGTAAPYAAVKVTQANNVIAQTTADALGAWSTSIATPLQAGDHTLVATATSAQGLQLNSKQTLQMNVDLVVNAPKFINQFISQLDAKGEADGSVLLQIDPTSIEPRSTFAINFNDGNTFNAQADANGVFNVVFQSKANLKTQTVGYSLTDENGNIYTGTFFYKDIIAPIIQSATPTINKANGAIALEGVTEANAVVKVTFPSIQATSLYVPYAVNDGVWSIPKGTAIPSNDASGNAQKGVASPNEKVTIFFPDGEVTTTADADGLWSYTTDKDRTGNATENVVVYANYNYPQVFSTTATTEGKWSITSNGFIPTGFVDIVATDESGNKSDSFLAFKDSSGVSTREYQDKVAPAIPYQLTGNTVSQIIQPNTPLKLQNRAEAFTTVKLVHVGTDTPKISSEDKIDYALSNSDNLGEYSFTIPTPSSEGVYRYQLTSVDAAGNASIPLISTVYVAEVLTKENAVTQFLDTVDVFKLDAAAYVALKNGDYVVNALGGNDVLVFPNEVTNSTDVSQFELDKVVSQLKSVEAISLGGDSIKDSSLIIRNMDDIPKISDLLSPQGAHVLKVIGDVWQYKDEQDVLQYGSSDQVVLKGNEGDYKQVRTENATAAEGITYDVWQYKNDTSIELWVQHGILVSTQSII